jgi:phosphoglycolate phosphatase-like HAD superfamily hydrolase
LFGRRYRGRAVRSRSRVATSATTSLPSFAVAFLARLERALTANPCAETPGAGALLERVRSTPEVVACIATGGWERSARRKLAAAGIDVSGLAFASCNDARNRRDIVRTATRRACALAGGEEPSAYVSVGDGVWDVVTARQLGMAFIGVARGEQAVRLRDLGAAVVIEDFTDTDAFLAAVTSVTADASARLAT